MINSTKNTKENQNNETPEVDEDATIIIYADDNTPITADKDPENLEKKVQHGATLVTDWFAKNGMVCSGDKTKLLIVSTQAARAEKITPIEKVFRVNVC